MDFADILCGACGKMTFAHEAIALDYTLANLVTGYCKCIFHRTCCPFIPRTDDGKYCCGNCHATAPAVRSLTHQTCLKCTAYALTPYCQPCWHDLVLYLTRQLTDGESLLTAVTRYMPSEQLLHRRVFIALTLYQLYQAQQLPFLVFYAGERLTFMTFENVLLTILRHSVRLTPRLELRPWLDLARPNFYRHLPGLVPFLANAADIVQNFGSSHSLILQNGYVQLRREAVVEPSVSTYVFGQALCANGMFEEYEEFREQGLVTRLFLPNRNDFLYYRTPKFACPPEPEFYTKWQLPICLSPVMD